jgi:hypothetical protein
VARDVFISHSRTDADVTSAACVALEQAGISCWTAPRDILPSQTWSGAIVEAIGACRVFVVALSERANASTEVVREVELAAQRHKPTLTWRIEAVKPTGPLEYFLSGTQWQDAFARPLQPKLQELVATVGLLLGRAEAQPPPPEPSAQFVEVDLDDFGAPTGRVGGFFQRLLRDR